MPQLTRDYVHNGGIGSYVQDLTALLEAARHEVAVICSEGAAADGPAIVERIAGFDEVAPPSARANPGRAGVVVFLTRRGWRLRDPRTAALFYRRAAAAVAGLRTSEVIFAASAYVRGRIVRQGVAPERVVLAPYFPGVPGLPDEPLPSRPDGYTLLFAGRLTPEKGVEHPP